MPNPYYSPYWLEHHGVKNQEWGKKNGPPYPLDRGKDGRVTQTQKKKKQGLIARMKANKKKKARNAQLAKAREAKAKKAEEIKTREELRKELLNSTDPKFILQHIDLLDTKEINDRLSRIDAENKVRKLTIDNSTKKKVDKGMEWINKVKDIAEATSKVASAYSAVYDASQKKVKTQEEAAKAKKLEKENKEKARKVEAENKEKARKIEEANRKREAENKEITNSMRDIIKMYTSGVDSLADIKVNFNPQTGALSFETITRDKENKKGGK